MISLEEVENKIKNMERIAIIANKENIFMIPEICSEVYKINNSVKIVILEPVNIICRLKVIEFEFYIILGTICPLHKFENYIAMNKDLSDIDIKKIEMNQDVNFIYDPLYNKADHLENKHMKSLVVSDNQFFFNYYYYQNDNILSYSLNNSIEIVDKTRFLISRIAKIDKIKERNVFGILYTSPFFQEDSKKLKHFLMSKGKKAYLIYLKDISYERLTCMDGIDCIVVFDCPLFTHFNINVFLVTPFEIALAYKSEWNGEYKINEFEFETENIEETYTLEKYYETGNYLLEREFQGVKYEDESEKEMEIQTGVFGIPTEYERKTNQ